jgi:copper chaperone CopZ
MATPIEKATAMATPKEETTAKPRQYHLLCDTMSCDACEEAVVATLSGIPNVIKVEASREKGTIVVSTNSCNSCIDCQCCKCEPGSCEVCRCCGCGVDKYLAALEDIDHHATYPMKKKPSIKLGEKRLSFCKFPEKFDLTLALAFGIACFAVGVMLKSTSTTRQT